MDERSPDSNAVREDTPDRMGDVLSQTLFDLDRTDGLLKRRNEIFPQSLVIVRDNSKDIVVLDDEIDAALDPFRRGVVEVFCRKSVDGEITFRCGLVEFLVLLKDLVQIVTLC